MDRELAHKLVDELFNSFETKKVGAQPNVAVNPGDAPGGTVEGNADSQAAESVQRELPEGKRVVRTKTSGDRVYLIDETKKTRQWLSNPDVLTASGFEIGDVVEIEDSELLRYQMGPALLRVDS